MKEIKQGTLYGCDLVLKVPEYLEEDETINENTLENHIKREKKYVIQQYQDQQFLEKLEKYNKNSLLKKWLQPFRF